MFLDLGRIEGLIPLNKADIEALVPQTVHAKIPQFQLHCLCGRYLLASTVCAHSHIASSGHMEVVVSPEDYNFGFRGTLAYAQMVIDFHIARN